MRLLLHMALLGAALVTTSTTMSHGACAPTPQPECKPELLAPCVVAVVDFPERSYCSFTLGVPYDATPMESYWYNTAAAIRCDYKFMALDCEPFLRPEPPLPTYVVPAVLGKPRARVAQAPLHRTQHK